MILRRSITFSIDETENFSNRIDCVDDRLSDYSSRYIASFSENCIQHQQFLLCSLFFSFDFVDSRSISTSSAFCFFYFSIRNQQYRYFAHLSLTHLSSKFVKSLHHKLFCWISIFCCFSLLCCKFFHFSITSAHRFCCFHFTTVCIIHRLFFSINRLSSVTDSFLSIIRISYRKSDFKHFLLRVWKRLQISFHYVVNSNWALLFELTIRKQPQKPFLLYWLELISFKKKRLSSWRCSNKARYLSFNSRISSTVVRMTTKLPSHRNQQKSSNSSSSIKQNLSNSIFHSLRQNQSTKIVLFQ